MNGVHPVVSVAVLILKIIVIMLFMNSGVSVFLYQSF